MDHIEKLVEKKKKSLSPDVSVLSQVTYHKQITFGLSAGFYSLV